MLPLLLKGSLVLMKDAVRGRERFGLALETMVVSLPAESVDVLFSSV